jgi:hypothetical protein
MENINYKNYAEKIIDMAETLEDWGKRLRMDAEMLVETEDLSCISTAINNISNCILNLRIDAVAARPLRDFEKNYC